MKEYATMIAASLNNRLRETGGGAIKGNAMSSAIVLERRSGRLVRRLKIEISQRHSCGECLSALCLSTLSAVLIRSVSPLVNIKRISIADQMDDAVHV